MKSLLSGVEDDFFDEDSDDDEGFKSNSKTSPIRPGRPTTSGEKFTKRRPPKGAPAKDIAAYEKARKRFYDAQRKKKLRSPNKRAVTEYTGDQHPTLRTMVQVEKARLAKGQTFESREILLLRIKEEANLRGISIKVQKSDSHRLIVYSRDDPSFVVIANQSMAKGYQVNVNLVREMDTDPQWDGEIPGGMFDFNHLLCQLCILF